LEGKGKSIPSFSEIGYATGWTGRRKKTNGAKTGEIEKRGLLRLMGGGFGKGLKLIPPLRGIG